MTKTIYVSWANPHNREKLVRKFNVVPAPEKIRSFDAVPVYTTTDGNQYFYDRAGELFGNKEDAIAQSKSELLARIGELEAQAFAIKDEIESLLRILRKGG